MTTPNAIHIYTDGACVKNPGPGGYGTVILWNGERKELSGGFKHTTNNRMEILAAIEGLAALPHASTVILFSDSQYVVNAISKGWAKKWRKQGWMRNAEEAAVNPDLWVRLLELCEKHDVTFQWVRGHNGVVENERCDRLAVAAANDNPQRPDTGYKPV